MATANITAARLRELLAYNPETGLFVCVQPFGRNIPGQVVGRRLPIGYVQIGIDGRHQHAHRLAMLYVNGVWPNNVVDHKNGDRSDNRWCNLRDCTQSVNIQNLKGPRRDNRSGYLGVSPNGKRWNAMIRVNKKRHYLGTFDTPSEAYEAYITAKRRMHEGCLI